MVSSAVTSIRQSTWRPISKVGIHMRMHKCICLYVCIHTYMCGKLHKHDRCT